MKTLYKYKKDFYSQNGEDGILQEIFKRLKINKGWFVEFGAWDGIHLSNTFNLLKKGWKGIDIEGDPERYRDLVELSKRFPKLHILERFIKTKGEDSLDNILSLYPLDKNFDLLSIDIDSNDYGIWDSLENYKPKVVIVEVNSRMNSGVIHVSKQGSSFTSMVSLGKLKGYHLVCHTGNVIFVRNNLVGKLDLPMDELENPGKLFCNNYTKPIYKLKRFLWLLFK